MLGAKRGDVPVKVAEAYQMLQMTNFPERAATCARNIKRERPALIGLQEVSLIQLFDTVGTFVEQTDFLDILMGSIHELGLDYRLADSVQNIDITVPRFAGFDAEGNPILDYVRLVDADVILVRGDVSTSATMKGHYIAALPVVDLGIEVPRGYVSVVAQVENRSCRFVSTHLEAFAEQVRLPQAQELAYILSGETLPTIVVGDFNTSEGNNSPYEDATYQFLTGAGGFTDTWVHNLRGNQGPGYTFGHDPDLMNPYPHLTQRLDLILVLRPGKPAGRHLIGPVQAEVLGDELKDRTPYLITKLVVPGMKKNNFGRIINIASTAGQRGEAFHSHYAASKGGMISLTKSLASELGRHNITVNCVAPGWVITDMTTDSLDDEITYKKVLGDIPLNKIAKPERNCRTSSVSCIRFSLTYNR